MAYFSHVNEVTAPPPSLPLHSPSLPIAPQPPLPLSLSLSLLAYSKREPLEAPLLLSSPSHLLFSAMKDAGKLPKSSSFGSDLKALFAVVGTRRMKLFAYFFGFAFVACTVFLAFNPSSNGSPLFNNFFTSSSFSSSTAPYRSQISSLFSYILPNSSSPSPGKSPPLRGYASKEVSAGGNQTGNSVETHKDGILGSNEKERSSPLRTGGSDNQRPPSPWDRWWRRVQSFAAKRGAR